MGDTKTLTDAGKPQQLFFLVLVVLLAGCSFPTLRHTAVAEFKDGSDVFFGEVEHYTLQGTSYIVITGENSKVKCSGMSHVLYAPPTCKDQRGVAILFCDDSRIIDARWTSIGSCRTVVGVGTGTDKAGNKFRLVFGVDRAKALDYLHGKVPEAELVPAALEQPVE